MSDLARRDWPEIARLCGGHFIASTDRVVTIYTPAGMIEIADNDGEVNILSVTRTLLRSVPLTPGTQTTGYRLARAIAGEEIAWDLDLDGGES